MIKNYIKIAIRNLIKYKGFSFISVTGLAIGMACCMSLLLWTQNQLSFDRFHKNGKNIYLLEVEMPSQYGVFRGRQTPYPIGPAIKESIPGIKNVVRIRDIYSFLVQYKEKQFYENLVTAVDPSFLKMFSFPLIKGNPEKALNQLHLMVISEEVSKKYFGDIDPIGKILSVNN